jgi:predicted ATPase/transcriptional regulator with XRE-family HTH domain
MGSPAIPLASFTSFGSLLKYLRRRAQLTQQELAIAVGYSEAQISRLENGQRPPEPVRLAALIVPALHLEDEPEIVTRLLDLAGQARNKTPQARQTPIGPETETKTELFSWNLAPRSNLPAELTAFIGREQEISSVCQCVLDHRLVTLTGAGGVGKTRLALRAVEELLEYFSGGAWLVELAPLSDPELAPRLVADTLGVHEQPGQNLLQALEGILKINPLLLVLDNCEHVIGVTASLVSRLLQACPELHILATSREILGVEGEIAYRCPSLTLPGAQSQVDFTALAQSEAVRLFVERTRSNWPDFTLTEANAALVAQICRRLDGIPLAIELAAARTRMLSVEQIAARLDQSFDLLTGGSRSALPRHQTLKALIDWSYDLLSPQEATLLQRLAVFAGGWTLEAAESMCPGQVSAVDTVELHKEQILELLGQLIDKSLIQFEPLASEEPRYRMLETVRQYARQRLAEAGGEETMRARHLDYFLCLCLQAEPHLRAWQAKTWLDRLDRELDNLRLAMEYAHSHMIVKGLQLAASLLWFWGNRGHRSEGMTWVEALLVEQGKRCGNQNLDLTAKVTRGRALNVLSLLIKFTSYELPQRLLQLKNRLDQDSQSIFQEAGEAGRLDYAISLFNQAKTLEEYSECRTQFQAIGDSLWIATCNSWMAEFYPPVDKRFAILYEEALALLRSVGDQAGVGEALYWLGYFEVSQDNVDRAVELTLKALDCFKAVGNRIWVTRIHSGFTNFYTTHGDYKEAIRQSELMLAAAQELDYRDNQYYLFGSQSQLARIAWSKKEYDLGVLFCKKALELGREYSMEEKEFTLCLLSHAFLSLGQVAQARSCLNDIFKIEKFWDDSWSSYHTIQIMSVLAVREGKLHQAALWFGVLDGQVRKRSWLPLESSPAERSEYEQALAAARAGLSEDEFAAAWEAGLGMTPEQVVRMSLDLTV